MSEINLDEILKEFEILVDKAKVGNVTGAKRGGYGSPCGNESNNPCDERCTHANCDTEGLNYCKVNNQGCHELLEIKY